MSQEQPKPKKQFGHVAGQKTSKGEKIKRYNDRIRLMTTNSGLTRKDARKYYTGHLRTIRKLEKAIAHATGDYQKMSLVQQYNDETAKQKRREGQIIGADTPDYWEGESPD